jgi:hypothetical protein
MSFNAYRRMILGCRHDFAYYHECEPHAIIQKYRPVDEGFNDLPRKKGLFRCKEKILAADIQDLAGDERVSWNLRFQAPAFDRETQRVGLSGPMLGDVWHGTKQ